MYTSNGKNSPEGIEDLEFGFLERGCLSSVPSSAPPEGAGGGGDEDRWWCSDGGVEGGEEERTGCDADLNFQIVNSFLFCLSFTSNAAAVDGNLVEDLLVSQGMWVERGEERRARELSGLPHFLLLVLPHIEV